MKADHPFDLLQRLGAHLWLVDLWADHVLLVVDQRQRIDHVTAGHRVGQVDRSLSERASIGRCDDLQLAQADRRVVSGVVVAGEDGQAGKALSTGSGQVKACSTDMALNRSRSTGV